MSDTNSTNPEEVEVPTFKAPEDTSASALISLQKSGWMILQSCLGFAVSIATIKIQAKFGVVIPQDLQAGAIAGVMVIATSAIHGISNFIKHKLADKKIEKAAKAKA